MYKCISRHLHETSNQPEEVLTRLLKLLLEMLFSVYSHFLVIVRLIVTGLKLSNHCSDADHSVTEEWIKIF